MYAFHKTKLQDPQYSPLGDLDDRFTGGQIDSKTISRQRAVG